MAEAELKRLRELANRAAHTGIPRFSRFLEPPMENDARRAAAECGTGCLFYGGFDGAERRMAAFFDAEPPAPERFPMRAVRIEWNAKFACPGHRDLLGAVMGLGVERDALGDIAMAANRERPCAVLFVTEDLAEYVAANLTSAGRAAVKARIVSEIPEIASPEGDTLRVTVQNERLDAVLAAGCHLSRAEAQRLIAGGMVKLNHVPCLRADARLVEGDLISARGVGRLRVEALPGESRRGRHIMVLFRYKR